MNLIPRLYDVTGGKITLDGKDIRNIKMSDLREEIGFVPQKGVLFSGTIASNLRFAKKKQQMRRLRRRPRSHRRPSSLRQKMTDMTVRLRKVEAMCLVDRSSVLGNRQSNCKGSEDFCV